MKSIIIYDWMISKCKLAGNELILFASLYETYMNSHGMRIEIILHRLKSVMSRATIYRCLDNLLQKGFLYRVVTPSVTYFGISSLICDALNEADVNLKKLIEIAKVKWVNR